MSKTPSPSVNEDYEAIEAAVLETARGRWFLAEYLRRHQAAETRALLDAIRKLENALGADGRHSRDILAAMERTAGELAEIGHEPFAAALPEAVMHMAEEAATIAARIESLGEESGDAGRNLPALLAAQQHLMARKLEAVAGCLREISIICGEETPQQTEEPAVEPEQTRWFSPDAELFEGEIRPADSAPAAGEEGAEPSEPVTTLDSTAAPFMPAGLMEAASHEPGTPATGTAEDTAAGEERTGHLSIIIEPGKPEKVHRETRITDAEEESRPRIIITRKRSSNEVDIPMADHEEKTASTKAATEREPEKSEA